MPSAKGRKCAGVREKGGGGGRRPQSAAVPQDLRGISFRVAVVTCCVVASPVGDILYFFPWVNTTVGDAETSRDTTTPRETKHLLAIGDDGTKMSARFLIAEGGGGVSLTFPLM